MYVNCNGAKAYRLRHCMIASSCNRRVSVNLPCVVGAVSVDRRCWTNLR